MGRLKKFALWNSKGSHPAQALRALQRPSRPNSDGISWGAQQKTMNFGSVSMFLFHLDGGWSSLHIITFWPLILTKHHGFFVPSLFWVLRKKTVKLPPWKGPSYSPSFKLDNVPTSSACVYIKSTKYKVQLKKWKRLFQPFSANFTTKYNLQYNCMAPLMKWTISIRLLQPPKTKHLFKDQTSQPSPSSQRRSAVCLRNISCVMVVSLKKLPGQSGNLHMANIKKKTHSCPDSIWKILKTIKSTQVLFKVQSSNVL